MTQPADGGGPMPVGALILSGGLARRMDGQDKGLISLGGKPLVQWVLERVRPQVDEVLINANRNLDQYARLGVRVVPDHQSGFAGPLAGLATGMAELTQPLVFMCPCDSPLLAEDIVARLRTALLENRSTIAVATDGDRLQPVFALARRDLAASLQAFLGSGQRKIDQWYAQENTVQVSFPDRRDSFVNVNTEQQLGRLAQQFKDSEIP